MTLEAFLEHLENPRRSGGSFIAPCPSHADRSPFLSISEGDDGRVLLHCFSGCFTEEIVESLSLSMADLFPGKQTRESRNHYRKIKVQRKGIKQAGFSLAGAYRSAERVIQAARGNISEWSPEELDRAWIPLAEAYEVLQGERRYET